MANNEHMRIRLQERIRVYRNSPNCNATFADLQMFVEDMVEILDSTSKSRIGFGDNTKELP